LPQTSYSAVSAAAEQAGIPPDRFEIAILSAFADLQPRLALPPLAAVFSGADRELVNLLMLSAVNQIHQRVVLFQTSLAVVSLATDAILAAHHNQTVTMLDGILLVELRSLESALADPLVLQDETLLLPQQLNVIARSDIFLLWYGLELNGLPMFNNADIYTRVIERMQAVGGVMAGMTAADLIQSGVAGEQVVETPDGPVTLPSWSFDESAVYDWVQPGMALSYQADASLADEILRLGGTPVPIVPDFTPFAHPFLAVFQLRYDFSLLKQIDSLEWIQSEVAAGNFLLSMQKRLDLRHAQANRRQLLLDRFTGATEQEKQAIASYGVVIGRQVQQDVECVLFPERYPLVSRGHEEGEGYRAAEGMGQGDVAC